MISKPAPTASRTADEPRHVLGDVRPADLDLGAAEALRLGRAAHRRPAPAARGAASRPRSCRADTTPGRRRPRRAAAARRGGSAGPTARCRSAASASEVIAPTVVACVWNSRSRQISSIALGIAADQARREVIGEQRHDRRAAGADGVAVAGADRAIAVEDAHDRRLLRHEALDRVGALDLGLQVDHHDLDPLDDRPWRASVAVGSGDRRPRKRSVAATSARGCPARTPSGRRRGRSTYSASGHARCRSSADTIGHTMS